MRVVAALTVHRFDLDEIGCTTEDTAMWSKKASGSGSAMTIIASSPGNAKRTTG